MFGAIFYTQWKWTRTVALLLGLAGFAIPVASLQSAAAAMDPQDFLSRIERWGAAYALLAAAVGLLVALAAWGHDHAGRHIYALSLPIARHRYVLYRFGAGALLLLPAIVGVLIGAIVVSTGGLVPVGLHAFPWAITLRFALCALLAFALFFSIGSATTKTAALILGALGGVLFAQYLISLTGTSFNLLEVVANYLFVEPGLLSVFSGRWMLIDV